MTQDEQSLRDTLASCDTQGSLDSIALDSMAQCSLPQVNMIRTATSDYGAYDYVYYTATDSVSDYYDYEQYGRINTCAWLCLFIVHVSMDSVADSVAGWLAWCDERLLVSSMITDFRCGYRHCCELSRNEAYTART